MKHNREQELLNEFYDFVEVDPVEPPENVGKAIKEMVTCELVPHPVRIYSKLTVVEAASGLLTLAICPQFGFGFMGHDQILHSLHAVTTPAIYYLLCGVFFVLLGACLSGLVLSPAEIKVLGKEKFFYFAAYSVLAYLALTGLGSEAFALVSLTWIFGAFLGNLLGFETLARLRRVITTHA